MFTTLGLVLAYLFLLGWIFSGLVIAAVTSKWITGKTAMSRLPKSILVIFFWPVWMWLILSKK